MVERNIILPPKKEDPCEAATIGGYYDYPAIKITVIILNKDAENPNQQSQK